MRNYPDETPMTPFSHADRQSGYTITEVLVALLLVTTVVTPLSLLFSRMLSGHDQTQRIVAINLATEKLEHMLISGHFIAGEERQQRGQYALVIETRLSPLPFTDQLLRVDIFVRSARRKRPLVNIYRLIPVAGTIDSS